MKNPRFHLFKTLKILFGGKWFMSKRILTYEEYNFCGAGYMVGLVTASIAWIIFILMTF